MINSTFQVTFGIEIEAVLAFNQSLLQNHLDSIGSPSKIIKDIPDTARRDLNQASSQYLATREKWMSWALTTPTAYSPGMSEMRMQEHFEEILLKYGYRGYGGEILDLAQSLLPEGVRVHDHFGKNKYDDFSHWHLTHDRGVYGVGKERLADQLRQFRQKRWENRTMLERIFDFCRGREAPAEKIDEWDTHGLELVSRVLPYEPSSFAEIEQHVTPLLGLTSKSPQHTAFPTEHCGLHVHVGLPTPPDLPPGTPEPVFSLPTLQHLAYILVMYESEISKLHPERRRPSHPASQIDLQTNIDWVYAAAEEQSYDLNDDDDNYNNTPTEPDEFALARARIFAPSITLASLVALMSANSKHRIVNWLPLLRPRARTLEFRQHEGSLDIEAVRRWTGFVVGLVRLAETMGRTYGAGEGYRWREWSGEMGVGDLVEMMDGEIV